MAGQPALFLMVFCWAKMIFGPKKKQRMAQWPVFLRSLITNSGIFIVALKLWIAFN
mgnify:CR=1 FL=1